MYVIVDIETTGGSFKHERITEIAIYSYDGENLKYKFLKLINPEKSIPYFITNLTGISNEMVSDAPRFYEVAKQIVEIMRGKIFVAHNATFDYNFIKNEFKELGFDFKLETLCTVKLSRKLFPGLKSYSLGELCNSLNIELENRHRAAGDALATVKLFDLILKRNSETGNKIPVKKEKYKIPEGLHPDITIKTIEEIPEAIGVYYLLNEKNETIYIGKSKNLRDRVLTHLRNMSSRKTIEMATNVALVGHEICGNELIALLLESEEIKKHKPLYNRMQRRTGFAWGLFSYEDRSGYLHLAIEKTTSGSTPVTTFHTHDEAIEFLETMIDKYTLCQKFCGLYNSTGPCFYCQIGKCNGACTGNELSEKYNSRVKKLLKFCSLGDNSFLIMGEGRHNEEFSVVKVINGAYCGFSYFDSSTQINNIQEISENIPCRMDNRDVRMIIKNYILRNPKIKIVKL